MDDASLRHLLGRLRLVEDRVAAAVAACRADDPAPDDRFRGLYVSTANVDRLLARRSPASWTDGGAPGGSAEIKERPVAVEAAGDVAVAGGDDLRLRRLARSFGLSPYDVDLLMVALAPDLDPRFEHLYAYLNNEVHRRRASCGLALDLCGAGPGAAVERRRLSPGAPLVGGGLVVVEEPERPFLTRALRVPDRVVGFLLGDDTPDPVVAGLAVSWVEAAVDGGDALERWLAAGDGVGNRLAYVRERIGAAGLTLAATALRRAGVVPIVLDLVRLGRGDDAGMVADLAAREARLVGGGLVAGPVEVLAERGAGAVRAFAEAPCPVVLIGGRGWDPAWSKEVPLLVEAPMTTPTQRAVVWTLALNGHGSDAASGAGAPDPPGAPDPAEATAQFRLTPEQVVRAARAARQQAGAEARPLVPADLHAGSRAQNAAGLEALARRIAPRAGWGDLVLAPEGRAALEELTVRVRYRERVLDSWGMAERTSKGRGITSLFAGDSGTGKTLSAEVVAGALGLDLYVIDLSTVVDKYIGETEKHLDRIFAEADRVNGVLLFDEADALFGKRSDVRDSHDRYANVEVAYLLQRMELFDGLAILTTNLRANVDEAFTRRLDAVIDFPAPEEPDRQRLWELHLRPGVPRTEDLDLPFLAKAFRLSGGNIRNVALAAAYRAAADDRPVSMTDLIRATEGEYRKLGHLCVAAEFGPYYGLLTSAARVS